MTHLVLIRHGETVWHAENRYAGRTDIPLSPRGHEQAERLARWASSARLNAIWASPLRRARQTAAPVEHATKLTVHVDPRLQELDFGKGEGLTRTEIERTFPKAFAAFECDPTAHPLPGGENPRHAAERALACLREIVQTHPDGRVLVIAHNTLIRLALCGLIGVPLSRYRSLFPSIINGALIEIRIDGDRTSLLRFNVPLRSTGVGWVQDDER
jgi:broad specificity phosphatase PhoE